jgi:hypothetical protein
MTLALEPPDNRAAGAANGGAEPPRFGLAGGQSVHDGSCAGIRNSPTAGVVVPDGLLPFRRGGANRNVVQRLLKY